MKVIAINGSARKNFNTAKMLNSALDKAKELGCEVEQINLYDKPFKGCISCFACKLKNSKTNGLCAYKDDLRPILEKCLDDDKCYSDIFNEIVDRIIVYRQTGKQIKLAIFMKMGERIIMLSDNLGKKFHLLDSDTASYGCFCCC